MHTHSLEHAQAIATPAEQLRQRLSIAKFAIIALAIQESEVERQKVKLLTRAIDEAIALLPPID
ncbi:MAG TPA: hypothetical protein V6D10_01455 [Trichocoleus sp.]|jgi:hypothetical protein